jgi:hypothetical protein
MKTAPQPHCSHMLCGGDGIFIPAEVLGVKHSFKVEDKLMTCINCLLKLTGDFKTSHSRGIVSDRVIALPSEGFVGYVYMIFDLKPGDVK